MAEPRVFISSTDDDLKDTKERIYKYVLDYGYSPVTFDKDEARNQPTRISKTSRIEEIKSCSLIIIIIKNLFSNKSKTNTTSETIRSDYNTAREIGLPIFVFIHQNSKVEFDAYIDQKRPRDFIFTFLENYRLANFIHEIYHDKSFRFINTFQDVSEVETKLRKLWAGLFQRYLSNARDFNIHNESELYINSFKLFYFRRYLGISQEKLAAATGIKTTRIQKFEDAGIKKRYINVQDFELATVEEIQSIANVLKCSVGNLRAGLPDDFLSQYLLNYFKNKGTKQRRQGKNGVLPLFKCKVVLFDFDGTLTRHTDNLTTWEKIWIYLKYNINECSRLHRRYSTSEITHREWCELTEKKFRAKKLHIDDMKKIASEIQLVNGTRDVIEKLAKANVKMYIVSGSIKHIIKQVLGDLYGYFEDVKANDFTFDNKSLLKSIIGTKYDFEGKADYIAQIIKENNINSIEALFIGNSLNDEWAHQSGVQTLCVNPTMTNPDHPFQWTYCIRTMDNFNEILPFLGF
jgi:HAD superfamily phosphoserine phosphatase-like hydrolase